jgi:methionyl-tRNA formyltransferase|nr:formyltransferase family protein [uncultured Allomuricauda sp.]
MRIVLLTQDEPFYLAKNINYLAQNLPENAEIVASVLFDVSPFGKKETFYQKARKTLRIFGYRFFMHYACKYIWQRVKPSQRMSNVLKKNGIAEVRLQKGVNHKDSLKKIKSYSPDLLISIAGNQIFKKELLELAPKGCLNLHTALLPKYRGLMPSFWVLKNNEKETGVSVFFVDEGIDSGPILVQERISIGNMTQEELINVSKEVGMKAIVKSVKLIKNGSFDLIENPDDHMTYYTFPTKKDIKEFKSAGKKFF